MPGVSWHICEKRRFNADKFGMGAIPSTSDRDINQLRDVLARCLITQILT